jgi:hypothetical protein
VPGSQNLTSYSNLAAGTYTWSVGAVYEPGTISTPAASWPSVTFTVLDPNPVLSEGKLYKEVSRPEIYVLYDGKKIHIPTLAALGFMGHTEADVTTVVDGALNGWPRFTFPLGKTPGSLLWPPTKDRANYAPLRKIPGSTVIPTRGFLTTVGEIRGWIRTAPDLQCHEDDLKMALELDSEWAVRQGIDLHDLLWVGNVYLGIVYPGHTNRAMITVPVIQLEINSFSFKGVYSDEDQKPPPDWTTALDCDPPLPAWRRTSKVWFPFDPTFSTFLPDLPGISGAQPAGPGVYVRVVGTLLTDNPHAWNPADSWYSAARDWHPGVNPMTDVRHLARWTEVHPPDLVEPVVRDPSLPMAKLAAIGLVAAPMECQAAALDLSPDQPRPPGASLGWEELRGPETFWPNGENASNRSTITDLGDRIAVRARVCGGGLGGSPGRFKAFYRVWWK